ADGRPIVGASRLDGRPLPERVAGIALIDALAGRAARDGHGVYLLGARRPVVEAAARTLSARHPGLAISGVADGYFGAAEAPERACAVRRSGARILLLGMGVPRQEFFLEEQWDELGASVVIGVGGSFEILAGARRRAPHWCQRAGLEWLWRFAQEPRRLGPRYLVTNSQFLRELLGARIHRRRAPRGAAPSGGRP